MKCLSLWQPWATLMAIGAKRIETRSWETLYRGPLAIHAAKKWNRELEDMCHTEPFRRVLMAERPNAGGMFHDEDALKAILPFGAIVAVVRLVDCAYIEPRTTPIERDERAFGDYTHGRFAWQTTGLRKLAEPIPFRGAQGLFDIPDDLIPTEEAATAAKE